MHAWWWLTEFINLKRSWIDEWMNESVIDMKFRVICVQNVLQERDITFNLLFIIHISYIYNLNFIYGFMEPIIVVS